MVTKQKWQSERLLSKLHIHNWNILKIERGNLVYLKKRGVENRLSSFKKPTIQPILFGTPSIFPTDI